MSLSKPCWFVEYEFGERNGLEICFSGITNRRQPLNRNNSLTAGVGLSFGRLNVSPISCEAEKRFAAKSVGHAAEARIKLV